MAAHFPSRTVLLLVALVFVCSVARRGSAQPLEGEPVEGGPMGAGEPIGGAPVYGDTGEEDAPIGGESVY